MWSKFLFAVGEGLEPPQAFARRFSRPLHYHYANPPARNTKLINLSETKIVKTCFFLLPALFMVSNMKLLVAQIDNFNSPWNFELEKALFNSGIVFDF